MIEYPPFAEQWLFLALFVLIGLGLGGAFAFSESAAEPRHKLMASCALLVAIVVATAVNLLLYPQSYETFHASALILTLGLSQVASLLYTSSAATAPTHTKLVVALTSIGSMTIALFFTSAANSVELAAIDQYTSLSQFTKLDTFFIPKNTNPTKSDSCDREMFLRDAAKERASVSAFIQRGQDAFAGMTPTKNVLLITVESLRYDHTSLDEGREDGGPLRRWASRGVSFKRAYSPSPKTLTSISSYMALKHPHQLDILFDRTKHWLGQLSDNERTLAEVASSDGRATFAAYHGRHIGEDIIGLEQGFDELARAHASSDDEKRDADEQTLASATRFIDEHGSSDNGFFGWVFFVSPHRPYFLRGEDGVPKKSNNTAEAHISEVTYSEGLVDRLLKHLEARGALEDTMIVITGDHGEATGEHKMYGHRSLYEHQIRVPFVVIHPSATPRTVATPTQTLHALAWAMTTTKGGLGDHARQRLDGELGLVAAALGSDVVLSETISRTSSSATLIKAGAKVIWTARHDASKFYALEKDPKESSGSASPIDAGLTKAQHAELVSTLRSYINAHACQRTYRFGDVRGGDRLPD